MRYHAKIVKRWVWMYLSSHVTATKAVTADTKNPTVNDVQSTLFIPPSRTTWSSSYAVAPNIVGMPTRKANSAAAGRDVVPASIAAKMVAAEREVPGKTPATTWNTPTHTAACQVTNVLGGRFATTNS